jgi:hypothetical protein
MPPTPSLGELGGGLPGATGGLAGIGSQLADAIGGLLTRPDDALPEPPQLQDEAIDKAIDEDEPGADDEEPVTDEDSGADSDAEIDDLAETDEAAEESVDTCTEESAGETPPADPVATPPPAPMPPPPQPVVEPPPSAEAVGAQTPCEIAADELPQAGP